MADDQLSVIGKAGHPDGADKR